MGCVVAGRKQQRAMSEVVSDRLTLVFTDCLHLQARQCIELAVWMILPDTEGGVFSFFPFIPLMKSDRHSPAGVK